MIASVLATPQGAPPAACEGLIPFHDGNLPQRSTPPYEISIVQEIINRSYLVTIRAINPSFTFKGTIIQARNASAPESYETFGTFQRVVPADTDLQAVTCLENNDTATHTDNSEKSQVQIRWNTPPTGSGAVVFR